MHEQIARNKRRSAGCVCAFVVTWLGVGELVGWVAGTMTGRTGSSPAVPWDIAVGVVTASVLALAGVAFTLYFGARLVLSITGAQPADPRRYRTLSGLVEALAIGDGPPAPAVYVVDDRPRTRSLPASAPRTRRSRSPAGCWPSWTARSWEASWATSSATSRMTTSRLLPVVTTLIGMTGLLGSVIWRNAFSTRVNGRGAAPAVALILIAGALLAAVGFVVGPVIRLALSRSRESLADAISVELTGNPAVLIRALRTLEANDLPLARASHSTAAMRIDDPPAPAAVRHPSADRRPHRRARSHGTGRIGVDAPYDLSWHGTARCAT